MKPIVIQDFLSIFSNQSISLLKCIENERDTCSISKIKLSLIMSDSCQIFCMNLACVGNYGFSKFVQISTSFLFVTVFLPVCTNAKGNARTPDPTISPMMNTAVVHTVNPSGFPTDYKN